LNVLPFPIAQLSTAKGDQTMLTVKEVAEKWNVSPGIIYKLVTAGQLACHRIGSAIRFTEDQLKEYLQTPPKQPKPKQSFSHLDL